MKVLYKSQASGYLLVLPSFVYMSEGIEKFIWQIGVVITRGPITVLFYNFFF